MTTLRVGLSGSGALAQRAIAAARRHRDAEVVALHCGDPAALQALGAATGIHSRHTDFAALLQTGVDFVVLQNPPGERAAAIEAALAQGVPCLVQAPLCDDAATGARLVELADRDGVRLGVAVPGQDDPILEQLRQMVAGGWLGGPVFAQGCHGTAADAADAAQGSLADRIAAQLQLLTWLCGRPALAVTAQATHGLLGAAPDTLAATAALRGGVAGAFVASRLAAGAAFALHGTDGAVRRSAEHLWVQGQRRHSGAAFDYATPGAARVWTAADLAGAVAAAAVRLEPIGRFARWLDDRDDFPCLGEQAVADLRVAAALQTALRNRGAAEI